jgi:protein DGCR14
LFQYGWLYKAEEDSKEVVKESLRLPSIEEQASNDKRPLMVDTWNYRNKNYIMYVPDGKIEIYFKNRTICGHRVLIL